MNYSPFLNKNLNKRSMFKNKNQYRSSNSRQKNGRIFLVSSILSIAVLTTVISLLADSTQPVQAKNNDIDAANNKVTPLDLPEIGYQSEILSEAVSYTESNKVSSIKAPEAGVIDNNEKLPEKEVVSENEAIVEIETIQTAYIDARPQIADLEIAAPQVVEDVVEKKVEETVEQHEPALNTKTIVVKKGDTLSAILKRHSLSSSTLYKIVNAGKEAKKLTRIKPGQTFTIALDKDNQVNTLEFAISKVETLIVKRTDDKFTAHIETRDVDVVQQFTTATINNSLFSAGQKAGLDSAMIMKLAHIFGWDIDFALDIRKGDSFAVLYEEKYINGEKIGYGNILSAEFVNNGKLFRAIRYTDASGHTDYYSEDGLSMRKAFLRTPVEFSRISSRFSSGRKHPVLNRIRAHKGVDYAASRGTPIKAVGDGKVIFKGRKGGYGKVLILQHGSKYTTLYAHLNSYNKKLRNGSRVKQGQTIAYVGSTGLATGPHLHYEFRVNGVHRNPLTVSLPSAAPIAKKYRNDFKAAAETIISQLKLRKTETVALTEQ